MPALPMRSRPENHEGGVDVNWTPAGRPLGWHLKTGAGRRSERAGLEVRTRRLGWAGWLWICGLLAVVPARAEVIPNTLEESARVSVLVGWQRDVQARARTQGQVAPNGGPTLVAAFGYSPVAWGEIGIDLFAGLQPIWKGEGAPLGTAYGALLSGRLQTLWRIGPTFALIPRLGIHVGPAIVSGQSDRAQDFTEALGTGIAGSVSLEARVSARWSFNLGYRYLLAQGVVPGTPHVFNAGGHTLLLGATFSFLPETRGTWSL